MKIQQIALQMYTVRQHTANDMLGTLRALAQQGYRAVELAGYGNATLKEVKATLDELGIRAIAAHVSLASMTNQTQQVLDDLKTLGCDYAVVPSVSEDFRRTADDVRRLGETLNHLSEQSKTVGLQFAYHNHAFEFAPLDGSTMYDILATSTDPALVGLEVDVFWVQHGGYDPVAVIQQYAGRVPLIHVKDKPGSGDRPDAPVGEGVLPWNEILAAADAAGAQWYIVEQDHPADPMNDVQLSLQNLQRMAQ